MRRLQRWLLCDVLGRHDWRLLAMTVDGPRAESCARCGRSREVS